MANNEAGSGAGAASAWRHGGHRYSGWTIALHWVTLLLLAAVYACIELRELFPRGSDPRELLKALHYSLGLAVLAFLCLRFAALAAGGAQPPVRPALPGWQRMASRLVHLMLYVFLAAMPVLGWLMLGLEGKPVLFFGLELPPLASPHPDLGKAVEEIHETLGVAGYWLIGLHAGAALFHHYGRRDDTLRRMLPLR
ncbi:MAG TPA: cytochrome b [Burkholderiales bacterium]|nr:cytochrome b [Burkholderiales bacterium]